MQLNMVLELRTENLWVQAATEALVPEKEIFSERRDFFCPQSGTVGLQRSGHPRYHNKFRK